MSARGVKRVEDKEDSAGRLGNSSLEFELVKNYFKCEVRKYGTINGSESSPQGAKKDRG